MDLLSVTQMEIVAGMLAFDMNRLVTTASTSWQPESRDLAQRIMALNTAIKISEPVVGRYIDYLA